MSYFCGEGRAGEGGVFIDSILFFDEVLLGPHLPGRYVVLNKPGILASRTFCTSCSLPYAWREELAPCGESSVSNWCLLSASFTLGPQLSTFHSLFHSILTASSRSRCYHWPHLTGEESEAQGSSLTFPRSHNWLKVELGILFQVA